MLHLSCSYCFLVCLSDKCPKLRAFSLNLKPIKLLLFFKKIRCCVPDDGALNTSIPHLVSKGCLHLVLRIDLQVLPLKSVETEHMLLLVLLNQSGKQKLSHQK